MAGITLTAGRRILISAGASGIGRAIADRLIENGARVHVCDVSDVFLREFRAAHPGHGATRCDVSNAAEVDGLFAEVGAALGGLDALINNAGIAGPTAAVEHITPEDWRRTLDVGITGHFLCTRLAVPMLKAAVDGSIVNISSAAGRFGYAFRTPYAAAKWAVIGFTQSLAKELGPSGIRVNAILPGIIRGKRMEGVIRDRASQAGVGYETMKREYLNRISLRRMTDPEDVADSVLFLLSPAGRNISGQSLGVDGNVESL